MVELTFGHICCRRLLCACSSGRLRVHGSIVDPFRSFPPILHPVLVGPSGRRQAGRLGGGGWAERLAGGLVTSEFGQAGWQERGGREGRQIRVDRRDRQTRHWRTGGRRAGGKAGRHCMLGDGEAQSISHAMRKRKNQEQSQFHQSHMILLNYLTKPFLPVWHFSVRYRN